MYCPECGKKIPDGSKFCMQCGADLSSFRNNGTSPKIEVSPKIHVEAKAEGVPYPKWKPNVEYYVSTKNQGKLPVYRKFAEFNGKSFCPHCQSYDSLVKEFDIGKSDESDKSVVVKIYNVYRCLACNRKALTFEREDKYSIPTVIKKSFLED